MHCHVRHGMLLHSTASMNEWGILPDHIRASLAQYAEHKTATCLACGYYGPMGVVKGTARASWWLSWPVLIILCLSGVGLVVLIILALLRELSKEHSVVCPNCGRTLRV